MEITEVRVKLMPAQSDKLRAFCSITIDGNFVIRDLKIIDGAKGPFVAMPSRKLMERCPRCTGKNHQRAAYCNQCGLRLSPGASNAPPGRQKLHSDIAHPINARCREMIQKCILDEYCHELERAKDPAYQPRDIDDFDEDGWLDDTGALAGEIGGARIDAVATPGSRPPAPAAPPPPLDSFRPPRSTFTRPPSGAGVGHEEPEDNFGAGLFS